MFRHYWMRITNDPFRKRVTFRYPFFVSQEIDLHFPVIQKHYIKMRPVRAHILYKTGGI